MWSRVSTKYHNIINIVRSLLVAKVIVLNFVPLNKNNLSSDRYVGTNLRTGMFGTFPGNYTRRM